MNITGVVVEYNPFHNGHLYHLKSSKEITDADAVVAVMSGNFVQRGEPALFDKFTRAEAAVKSGVDLVIELPSLYATQSAEIFSYGAAALLNSLSCINSICFGSEAGNTEVLSASAKILSSEPESFRQKLSEYVKSGMLFATARSLALYDYINETSCDNVSFEKDEFINIMNSSNNILGLEYMKALLSLKSNISPFTIERISSSYNSPVIESSIASATSIRNSFSASDDLHSVPDIIKGCVPETTAVTIQKKLDDGFLPVFSGDFFEQIITIVLRDRNILADIFEISEGIENRILKASLTAQNISELESMIKTKRYTMTRVKRCLNNILLGIKKEDVKKAMSLKEIPYMRILAFGEKGRDIIREVKKSSDIKIINKFSEIEHFMDDENFRLLMEYDIKCTDIYNSVYYKNRRELLKGSMDYYIKPIYIKNDY
ncbi:nucleotidyltransferase [Peptacetobacter hominis]|uniref:tRNA(Met) cytidine acetate ligase n=1 Tax=Peptacetobacter hominis TaxID=2743610 RepID=A0A544QVF3_9FIRM|nr:nucleotidyltransferase [Peptacetobacter hominis]TQQ84674.1 nucleotidyltransferase [Peptacetobacter hominis]